MTASRAIRRVFVGHEYLIASMRAGKRTGSICVSIEVEDRLKLREDSRQKATGIEAEGVSSWHFVYLTKYCRGTGWPHRNLST